MGRLVVVVAVALVGCTKSYYIEGRLLETEGKKLDSWQWEGAKTRVSLAEEIVKTGQVEVRHEACEIPVYVIRRAKYEKVLRTGEFEHPCRKTYGFLDLGWQNCCGNIMIYTAAVALAPVTLLYVLLDGGLPDVFYIFHDEVVSGEFIIRENVRIPGSYEERGFRPIPDRNVGCRVDRVSGDERIFVRDWSGTTGPDGRAVIDISDALVQAAAEGSSLVIAVRCGGYHVLTVYVTKEQVRSFKR